MTTMISPSWLTLALLGASLSALAGCSSSGDDLTGGPPPPGAGPADPMTMMPPPGKNPDGTPTCGATTGRGYTGFGAVDLVSSRADQAAGYDRGRIKPYSAIGGEFARVIGVTPPSVATLGPTFGAPAPRFSEEPQASGVSIYAGYAAAFEGCLTYVAKNAQYGTAPTATSAATECTAMQRKFWSRIATPAEIAACVTVATVATGAEPDAHRKWAYTCASVLSADGFLTY